MTQTLAIFTDAYRGLKARKMFWIVLIISGLVVAAFACLGITAKGLKFIVWELQFGPTTRDVSPDVFYKSLFVGLGIKFWLAWLATILALISTAGLFPAFIARGSIDLVVARPISRWRLFLTQYAAGLLFVTFQIGIFCLASFMVIGIRGGAWEPGIFLAIPLVVCFFSYLFSICALLGLLTRSTVASLLLTLLVWFLLFSLHTSEVGVLAFKFQAENELARIRWQIDKLDARPPASQAASDAQTTGAGQDPSAGERKRLQDKYDENAKVAKIMDTVGRVLYGVKTVVPKTSETIGLVERVLIRTADLPPGKGPSSADRPPDGWERGEGDSPADTRPARSRSNAGAATRELAHTLRSRSVAWVIGTSLAFEAVILLLGVWVFSRRDF
ncbi:MAG TPA: ABC transporter permease [Phycisphaerae bacterium]|nr:ABC transporter permease [Phycisphaerae bacterium]